MRIKQIQNPHLLSNPMFEGSFPGIAYKDGILTIDILEKQIERLESLPKTPHVSMAGITPGEQQFLIDLKEEVRIWTGF